MKNEYRILGDIVEIYIKSGEITVIDLQDLPKAMEINTWYAGKEGYVKGGTRESKSTKKVLLHRYLMNPDDGLVVDHIDRDKLNNCRDNLRCISPQDNSRNTSMNKNNKSGFKGVTWSRGTNKWLANIGVNGKNIHLGYYEDFTEACRARARVRGELKYFGSEFTTRTPIILEST